jgi:AAA domain-containing protein/TIR domain-containing protein
MARIFISYKRTEPDASVCRDLCQALAADGHDVFVDVTMPPGAKWAERIEEQLHSTDILVALLSEQSVQSEMALGEIGTVHRLNKKILPVRLAYRDAFKYPLSAWLDPIHWAFWDGPQDTPRLVGELRRAIAGEAPPGGSGPARSGSRPVASSRLETGTMPVDSRFYVSRKVDEAGLAIICQPGGHTISIEGPRQSGKSSLLMRLLDRALRAEKRVVFVDCQAIDSRALEDADQFFRLLCIEMASQLDLECQLEPYWDHGPGNIQRCSRYVEKHVLRSLAAPLVLAIDGVDRLASAPFRSDFLGMIRSWHGKRALPTTPIWRKLDIVLVTSTEPDRLVERFDQSPFHVGERLELTDFTAEEVAALNEQHGNVLDRQRQELLRGAIGGHPYLVHRALHALQSCQATAMELCSMEHPETGPFADHLRSLLFLVSQGEELRSGMREVLLNGSCRDASLHWRLAAAGLVRSEDGRVVPRCGLYAHYFRRRLLG